MTIPAACTRGQQRSASRQLATIHFLEGSNRHGQTCEGACSCDLEAPAFFKLGHLVQTAASGNGHSIGGEGCLEALAGSHLFQDDRGI